MSDRGGLGLRNEEIILDIFLITNSIKFLEEFLIFQILPEICPKSPKSSVKLTEKCVLSKFLPPNQCSGPYLKISFSKLIQSCQPIDEISGLLPA
jgi:hypothetical protein